MKQIRIPSPIILKHPITDERYQEMMPDGSAKPMAAVTFANHVVNQWLNSVAFQDAEGIAMLAGLIKGLRESTTIWTIENAEHHRLLRAIEAPNPSMPLQNTVKVMLDPFTKAVKEATEVSADAIQTTANPAVS